MARPVTPTEILIRGVDLDLIRNPELRGGRGSSSATTVPTSWGSEEGKETIDDRTPRG